MVPRRQGRLEREPGANPGLPRSGKWKRCSSMHWVPSREATNGRWVKTRVHEPEDLPQPEGACLPSDLGFPRGDRPGPFAGCAVCAACVRPVPLDIPARPRGRRSTQACGFAWLSLLCLQRVQRRIGMAQVTCLGFPRIGRRRELKTALEKYWRGALDSDALLETARALRQRHWEMQREAGADSMPVSFCHRAARYRMSAQVQASIDGMFQARVGVPDRISLRGIGRFMPSASHRAARCVPQSSIRSLSNSKHSRAHRS